MFEGDALKGRGTCAIEMYRRFHDEYAYINYICERPHKKTASCILAYCSGSGINEIANEIVRLCGIVSLAN